MLIHNADITGSLTINGVPYNTGSYTGIFKSGTNIISGNTVILTGSFTGSFLGDGSQLSGVTSYTDADTLSFIQGYSGSYSGSFSGSFFGDGSNLSGVTSYTDADTLDFINSLNVVSGSIQTVSTVSDTFTSATSYTVTHNFGTKQVIVSVYENDTLIFPSSITTPTTNTVTITFPEPVTGRAVVVKAGHIVSGSINYNSVLNKPTLVSGSSQISFTGITNKPTLVSGSSQITYSGLTGIPSGIVSGSEQVTYSGLTGIPSGILSGSSQITYSGLTGVPSGIVSGSSQVAQFGYATTGSNQFKASQTITGSLTVTGAIVAQTLNVQQVTSSVVFSSGSNRFGNNTGNTHQFTGSVNITGSLAIAGAVYAGGATSASALTGASELIVQNEIGIQSANSTGPYLRMVAGSVNQNFTLVTGAASGSEPNLLFNVGGSTRLTISGSGASTFTGALNGTSAILTANEALTIEAQNSTAANNTITGYSANLYAIAVRQKGASAGIGGTTFMAQIIGASGAEGLEIYTPNAKELILGTNSVPRLTISSTGSATFSNSITSNYTYNGGVVGMLHLTSNGTEGGSITFEKTSGTAQKYKIGNSGAAFFVYDETGAKQPFTILNNGNVGIGSATSPVAALNVSNVPTSYFGIIETTGTSAGTVKHFRVHKPGYVEYGIGILADNSFHISTASTFPTTNGFTITSAGNVGMGTDNPLTRLDCQTANTGTVLVTAAFRDSSTNGNALQIWNGNNEARFRAVYYGAVASDQNITFYTIQSSGVEAERMRINSAGLVTKPFQTSFKAGRNSSYFPGANSNIIFNDTSSANFHFNIGNNYNTSNGVYTAPVAGRYVFTTCVIYEGVSEGQAMDDAFEIYINNVSAIYSFRRSEYVAGTTGNGGYYTDHATVILNLSAGDFVTVRNQRNIMIHGNSKYCWFTGYLLG